MRWAQSIAMSNTHYPLDSPYPLDPFSLEQRLSKQVFLVAGHHRHYAGSAPPDWSIPLLNDMGPADG